MAGQGLGNDGPQGLGDGGPQGISCMGVGCRRSLGDSGLKRWWGQAMAGSVDAVKAGAAYSGNDRVAYGPQGDDGLK